MRVHSTGYTQCILVGFHKLKTTKDIHTSRVKTAPTYPPFIFKRRRVIPTDVPQQLGNLFCTRSNHMIFRIHIILNATVPY